MRNTRLRNAWKENTWMSTESASITKMPPRMISSTSVLVITAIPATAPPSPSDPVSPMKIDAGNELNHKKPTHAPTRQPATSARSVWRVVKVMAMYASRTIAAQPAASPRGGGAGREGGGERRERDDPRPPRRQPVEAIGQVDRRRRPGDHEVDE